MKKYLFILAAAVVALASCNNGGSGNKYTKLYFKNAEVTVAQGDTSKLYLGWEPNSLAAPTCEWASSNEAVAKVDQKGNVAGIAAGEANITAKLGDLQAVCKVIVADPRAMYKWGGLARFGDLEPFEEGGELPIYDVELSDGVYKCQYGLATHYFWDDGIFIDGNSLAGEGYIFAMDIPCFVIAEGEDKGAGVGSPIYFIDKDFNPADTAYAYCVKAGSLGDAAEWAKFVIDEDTSIVYEDCWKGPECLIFTGGNFYYPMWPGILNKGYIYGNYKSMRAYQFSATWADEYYGLALDETGEAPKVPYEWATVTCEYNLALSAGAPKAKLAKKQNITNLKKIAMPNKIAKTSDKLVVKK